MNPVFVFLVILIGFLIWLTGSFLYRPIGRFFKRLITDAEEAMKPDETEKEEKDNEWG